ncbi:MAG: Do family serine endopeptidase [Gammaproteobacteria bacterium]|nr:MAG: Do family serine endopeptidase [Gammaproteobacteria bacterium]
MRRLWLIFAQAVTVGLAVFFLIAVLRPGYLPWGREVITVKEAQLPAVSQGTPIATFSSAARKAMPAVVNVYTSREVAAQRPPFLGGPLFRRFFGGQFEPKPERATSLGSGVVVSAQGYVLTNNHVVESADQIAVALFGGSSVPARVVGTDPETDLAVLKVDVDGLSPITFADSDQIGIGDIVLAIGNPFGVGQTVTMGIVSATGRSGLGINTFENFIQTDAAINPGNSGGALIDASGNLVGINTAIFSRTGGSQGVGFAIPANLAQQVMTQIVEQGTVVRGWIGVNVQDIDPKLATALKLEVDKGVLITAVLRGGPADKAGIRPGDVLLAVSDKELRNTSALLNSVSKVPPGETTSITFWRNARRRTVDVEVGRRPRLRAPR